MLADGRWALTRCLKGQSVSGENEDYKNTGQTHMQNKTSEA
jgi:hypothetical protein